MEAALPDAFDGYRIVRLLGAGGMGHVYLGHDTLLDRPVAIKFISTAEPDAAARQRFAVEARAIARLQHPCVVGVYRVGELDGRPYLVSEYVEGEPLDRLPVPLPWRRAAAIGHDLARGLATAHGAGVVHRDIKPANAMLAADGAVKLLDFGVARLLGGPTEPGDRAVCDASGDLGGSGDLGEVFGAGRADAAPPFPTPPADDPGESTRPVGIPAELQSAAQDVRPVGAAVLSSGLTLPGEAMGTPAYMAPEVWRGHPATYAADVYSLGALLFWLCTGRPPHTGATLADLRRRAIECDAEPVRASAPSVEAAFAAIVDKCLRRDPADRYPSANEVRSGIARLIEPQRDDVRPGGAPYRGLRAFQAEHQALFFGRDSESRAVLEKLTAQPVVAVAGDSGVGKSSLCRAGVLPRVGDWLDHTFDWSVVAFVPGRHPVSALIGAVASGVGANEEHLLASLADAPTTFIRDLRGALGRGRGLVMFIDQFEEVVTLADEAEARTIISLIGFLGSAPPGLRVLVSVRADFLGRVAAFPAVADVLTRALYFVRPLSRERVRDAIVGPAGALGVSFESTAMVDGLVEWTTRAQGGLPLLQFALDRLWYLRDITRDVITMASLESLGGVGGALGTHADDVLAAMLPDQREAARRLLGRLVTAEGTRARRSREELVANDRHAAAALDALVEGRLVVACDTVALSTVALNAVANETVASERTGGAGYEVAHEALLQAWATLAGWLSADASERVVRDRVAQAARDWARLGRRREALWTGPLLEETRRLATSTLAPEEAAFLDASRRQLVRAGRRRYAVAVAVVAALLATWATVRMRVAADLDERIGAHLDAADRHLELVDEATQRLIRLQNEAFTLFDRPDLQAGEAKWTEVQAARAELLVELGHAGQEAEAAVMLSPDRSDARLRLADGLYRRALLAEATGSDSARDEALERLRLYDDGESRRRAWDAPGQVALVSTPSGAAVVLERVVRGSDGRVQTEPMMRGTTPLDPTSLPPGSYLATLRLDGHAEVRAPFRVARGESTRLEIALPNARVVPADYVVVPRGWALFGSADPDALRKGFLHTVPQHPVETAAFLIARDEVTFGDWIVHLRTLAPTERAAQLPEIHAGGFEGALALREVDSHYELTIKPTTRAYHASEGESVRYPGRQVRATQDWRRFPVVGISVAQAEAYTAWLDHTGRVPGARLCTEHEWERAARGADDRPFPSGWTLTTEDANFDETYGKDPNAMGPDVVRSYPRSVSPFGLFDMAGNAWEWTVSSVEPKGHAARGGSYYFDLTSARSSSRETPEPTFRDVSVGFRVCATLPNQPR